MPILRQLRYAAANNGQLQRNQAHQLATKHALCHYASRSIYTFIPKIACSTMRLSLAIANGCIRDETESEWIHANNQTFSADLRDLATADFTFVILRDPWDRLSSVYLDKIVSREPDFWSLRAFLGREHDPDDFTFRQFAGVLSRQGALRHNIHWRPQVDFLAYEDYDLWVDFAKFSTAQKQIEDRAGFMVVDARAHTHHGNDRHEQVADGCFADTSPAVIRQMRAEGKTPAHAAMYDAELREAIAVLYHDDIALYRDKCVERPGG